MELPASIAYPTPLGSPHYSLSCLPPIPAAARRYRHGLQDGFDDTGSQLLSLDASQQAPSFIKYCPAQKFLVFIVLVSRAIKNEIL